MNTKRPIICFMGLDGSGKSTCIDYACEQLKLQGVNVEIVRAAYVVTVMSGIIKLGKKLLMNKNSNPFGGDYRSYLENMRKHSDKGFVYKVFSFLTTIEFKTQIFFRIILKHAFGKTLLVDRYIFDNVVTYAANLGLGMDYMDNTLNGKWKHAPRPDLIIYIKTPVDICFSRKDDTPDPLYLEIREPLYDCIAKKYHAVTISGAQDKQKMLNEVMKSIHLCMNK